MGQCRSPSVSPSRLPESTKPEDLSLFEQYLQGGNPFEMQIDNKEEETEDVLASNGVYFILYFGGIKCLLHMNYLLCATSSV